MSMLHEQVSQRVAAARPDAHWHRVRCQRRRSAIHVARVTLIPGTAATAVCYGGSVNPVTSECQHGVLRLDERVRYRQRQRRRHTSARRTRITESRARGVHHVDVHDQGAGNTWSQRAAVGNLVAAVECLRGDRRSTHWTVAYTLARPSLRARLPGRSRSRPLRSAKFLRRVRWPSWVSASVGLGAARRPQGLIVRTAGGLASLAGDYGPAAASAGPFSIRVACQWVSRMSRQSTFDTTPVRSSRLPHRSMTSSQSTRCPWTIPTPRLCSPRNC